MSGTMRQGLSNTLHGPTTPERVTLLHPPATTCLPHGPPCLTRCKAYAAYRAESMPHGGIKTKTSKRSTGPPEGLVTDDGLWALWSAFLPTFVQGRLPWF